MKQTINLYEFANAFRERGRQDNFTSEGLAALYDYLIELEESTDQELELDVIAFCCEYIEYENLAEFQQDYEGYDCMEDIEGDTTVIKVDDESFIIERF